VREENTEYTPQFNKHSLTWSSTHVVRIRGLIIYRVRSHQRSSWIRLFSDFFELEINPFRQFIKQCLS